MSRGARNWTFCGGKGLFGDRNDQRSLVIIFTAIQICSITIRVSQSPNNQVSKRPDDKMCPGNCRQKWQNGETGDTIWVRGCFIEPLDIPLHSAGAEGNISVKRPTNEWKGNISTWGKLQILGKAKPSIPDELEIQFIGINWNMKTIFISVAISIIIEFLIRPVAKDIGNDNHDHDHHYHHHHDHHHYQICLLWEWRRCCLQSWGGSRRLVLICKTTHRGPPRPSADAWWAEHPCENRGHHGNQLMT